MSGSTGKRAGETTGNSMSGTGASGPVVTGGNTGADTLSLLELNKALVEKFWVAFSASRFDEALDLLTDDATWWVAGNTNISGTYSKEEFRQLVAGVAESAVDGIKVTPTLLTAEGDRVSMEADSYGPMHSGKTYQNKYHFMHQVREGKLCAIREYLDTEHVTEIFG